MLLKAPIFLLLSLAIFFPITATHAAENIANTNKINLNVPHVWEIPDGAWVKPWNGACEEASLVMVDQFYLNPTSPAKIIGRIESKNLMGRLFPIEDRLFGSNSDTNATRTARLINEYTSFDATIKRSPTLDDIINELKNGNPVISLHYGFDLKNPLHRFRRGSSSYHVMVINGYDNAKKVFFVNDSELKTGIDFPYNYDIIMASLHDFNHTTKLATGDPTVLLTQPKLFVRAEGAKRIYLVRGNTKFLVSNPKFLETHGWSVKNIKSVTRAELDSYSTGPSFDN